MAAVIKKKTKHVNKAVANLGLRLFRSHSRSAAPSFLKSYNQHNPGRSFELPLWERKSDSGPWGFEILALENTWAYLLGHLVAEECTWNKQTQSMRRTQPHRCGFQFQDRHEWHGLPEPPPTSPTSSPPNQQWECTDFWSARDVIVEWKNIPDACLSTCNLACIARTCGRTITS